MLIASLVIATCGLSTVLIINASAKQSYANDNNFLIGNVKYQVTTANTQAVLTKQDYVRLRSLGFDQLIALAQSSTHIYYGQQRVSNRKVDISGIDTIALLPLLERDNANTIDRKSADDGANTLISLPFSNPVGIVHPTLLAQLNSNIVPLDGDKALNKFSIFDEIDKIASVSSMKTALLPPLLTFDDPSLGNDLITDISEFYRLFPNSELTSLLLVSSKSDAALTLLIERIRKALPSHLKVISLNDGAAQGELTKSFHLNLLAMALLMFVVCLFIVINAVNLLISARMPWFKISRQLGFSRRVIFVSQITEVVMITFFASCAGIYLSIYLSNLVAPSVQATLEGLYGVEVGFGNTSLLSLFVQVFSISVCGSIAATFAPFSLSNQALNSIRSNKNLTANHSSSSRNFWILSFLFALTSFVILLVATSLWLLLTATALLILAGCCLLLANYPSVIDAIYRFIPPSFVMLRISTKQSAALSGKTKIACCAFFIAATSNIGMNLMVDSFRGATVSWLETRLASDYYLYYEGKVDIALVGTKAEVEVFQRFENQIMYEGAPLQQYSYPSTPQFRDAMVFYKVKDLDIAWETFESGDGVFVNQQFAFGYGLGLNDVVNVLHPSNLLDTNYTIVGIIYDFGNPYKQVLLPLSQFDRLLSTSAIYSVNANASGLARFKDALEEQGIDSEKSLLNSEQLLAISKDAFDRTFIITDGLNIVTLLVAALSLAIAIVVLMNDVRPQNMLIRSLGVSAMKTQLLALFQYFILCIVALLFATPFGILLSWVLIFEINLQAFQWTYPLQIDLIKILQIYAVSLSIVLLLIALPIIRASKRPLIEDIRWLN